MLARNAARKQRRHVNRIIAASFAQLSLPWLAPAQVRWQSSNASTTSRPPARPRRRRSSQPKPVAAQTRCLATATDQYTPRYAGQYPPPGYSGAFRNAAQDENIPWDAAPKSKVALSNLRPYNDPIIINTSTRTPAQMIKVSHGIQGSAVDLLQHLHTSLQVGRLNRAEAIIQRLGDICSMGSAELLHAHTAYLEESVKNLNLHGNSEQGQTMLKAMHKWFEVEVRNKGVSIDAKLLVVMIRASIRALSGSQRDRSVRRYADMAKQMGEDLYYDVLESEDYDDNEFTIVGRLTYDEPETSQTQANQATTAETPPVHYRRRDVLLEEEIPDVLPMEQRGDGLYDIKRTLQDFQENPSLSAEMSVDAQYEQALKRQKVLEETSVEVAIDRWKKADDELRKIGIHTSMQSRPIAALMWQWHQALHPALEAELTECRKLLSSPDASDNDRYHYGPYLELLPLDKLAANTILFVLTRMNAGKSRQSGSYEHEVKLSQLTIGLAKSIEQECKMETSKQNSKSGKQHPNARNLGLVRRGLVQNAQAKRGFKKTSKSEQERQALLADLQWPMEAKVKLGAFLVSKLIETVQLPVTRHHPRTREKITQMQPAFLHRSKYEKGRKMGLLLPNPALVEKIESEPLGSLIAKRMPMVVEPKPWKSWNEGGYLHYSNSILRLPLGDHSGRDYFMAAHKKGDMSQIFAGLTALGQVPWKIHHGVFKVQVEAWNSGEEVANFAPLHPTFDLPAEADAADMDGRRRWLQEMRELENKRSGLHSKRCFQNFQLEIARTMVNETLYFPHNMDFRGRAYPIPPYLNHMGADNVRGLLVFADGKELGPTGLRWLKIHLATVAGHDKASMSERIEFTQSHLDDIYDSVRNPLNGRRWWLQAEDAWQTLAACFELTEALDSPDPSKYVSHLPIQQDGTCNGLQHYAALGGDKIGAAQVNLEPGDRPADVYTAVAEAVKHEVRKDAAAGNPIAQKLDGRITRKCVKQPVMTNVYGVTWFGAKEQVHKQLEVIFPDVRKYDPINIPHMSQYVATKIFKSLGEMFAGAQAIQSWLGICADRISTCLTQQQIAELTDTSKTVTSIKSSKKKTTYKTVKKEAREKEQAASGTQKSDSQQAQAAKPLFKSTVIWTTPLRLPVVQPYRSVGNRQVSTNLQLISIHDPQVWHPVSKRKQLQAFPPNFIHSLDATHMLLSALKCKELGMTFASIHDSFWTHACDVDKLSRVLRDAFIEMHKDNIVGRLREEFQTRYEGCMYLASVIATSPVGLKITDYRRSRKGKAGSGELALEAERLRLLDSSDAKEREKGEAMITPGSILATEGDEASLAAPAEIQTQALGTIPANAAEDVAVEATNTDADVVAAQTEGDILEANAETEPHAAKSETTTGKAKKTYHRKLFVWQPLTFPPVPPKGDFDVRKIRDSHYFFH